jgi:hypothetical protein
LACPPETDIANVFAAAEFQFRAALDDGDGSAVAEQRLQHLLTLIASEVHGAYAQRRGATRWADKSLTSARNAELLHRIFPEAQFICLFRECRDTVASLLEATPFGYQHFGLESYVRNNVGNLMLACALLWSDTVQKIVEFEDRYPDQCHRIRYEDLVQDPKSTVSALFRFLGAPWDHTDFDNDVIFARDMRPGYGDFKINYTKQINTNSVGRGATLPVGLIPPPLQKRINALQSRLGYPSLLSPSMRTFNEMEGAQARRELPNGAIIRLDGGQSKITTGCGSTNVGLVEIEELLRARLTARRAIGREVEDADFRDTIRIVLTDAPEDPLFLDIEHNSLRLSGTSRCTAISSSETLLALATGQLNPAIAARQSLVRVTFPEGVDEVEYSSRAYNALIAVLSPA